MAEIKLTKAEAELLLRHLWDDCAKAGKTCPKKCGNLNKPCIKIEGTVGGKLAKILGWDKENDC